jgi:hypothetical protein
MPSVRTRKVEYVFDAPADKVERLLEMRRLVRESAVSERIGQWYCGDRECNGLPHAGHHWCEHPICPEHSGTSEPAPLPGECAVCDLHQWQCCHCRADQRPPLAFTAGEARGWLIMAGRGFGKLLDPATPVPVPSGWTTMGALRVGDQVFDEAGHPCRVTAVFDEWPARAYRLRFSDGSAIIAGGEHQWVTWAHSDRKAYLRSRFEDSRTMPRDWPTWRARATWKGRPMERANALGPRIRTTDEIVGTLTYGKRGDRNHSIPVTGALALPTLALPIDPYVLGFWLGDGSSADATVTIGTDDAPEILERLAARGAPVTGPVRQARDGGCAGYPLAGAPAIPGPHGTLISQGSLYSKLKVLGVLRNKHVPSQYLRASVEQRLDLLRGLMDSDGSTGTGHVEFTNTKRVLADAVVELARSLGQKPVLGEGRAVLNGKDCGPKYRVTWRPTIQPFALSRKADRLTFGGAQGFRNLHRMIIGAGPMPVMPMRCITVDSPNSMYLAGEAMIPTHNTRSASEWLADQANSIPKSYWGVIGPDFDVVRDTCFEGESGLLEALGWERADDRYDKTRLRLRLDNGTMIRAYSAETPRKARGPNLSGAWLEELAEWSYREMWDNLFPAIRRGLAQYVATCTPKPVPLVREFAKDSQVLVTRGSTFANERNLSPHAIAQLREKWAGTRRERQELYGELMDDVAGALWQTVTIEATRGALVRREGAAA